MGFYLKFQFASFALPEFIWNPWKFSLDCTSLMTNVPLHLKRLKTASVVGECFLNFSSTIFFNFKVLLK